MFLPATRVPLRTIATRPATNNTTAAIPAMLIEDHTISVLILQFGFQLGNALFERADQLLDFLIRIARRDVFGTIPIEGKHLDETQTFYNSMHVRFRQLLYGVRVLARVHNASVAEDFEASALRIIHQEKGDAVVDGEVAGGKQLPIALVIGKGQSLRIQNAKKAGASAAM